MDYFRERNLIIETCLWLQEKELVIGTWGNVSLRLNNNLILVTPSRVEYEEMVPEDLVVVDMAGKNIRIQGSNIRNAHSQANLCGKARHSGYYPLSSLLCFSHVCFRPVYSAHLRRDDTINWR